jgi:hypothetical protein
MGIEPSPTARQRTPLNIAQLADSRKVLDAFTARILWVSGGSSASNSVCSTNPKGNLCYAAVRGRTNGRVQLGTDRAQMSHDEDTDFYSGEAAEGYSACDRCFDDDDNKVFIRSSANSRMCDFCGHVARTRSIAAPLDEIVEFMFAALDREYERAIEALGWDGREGGYQGHHWDSRELLTDVIGLGLPNDGDGRLLDILSDCFGDEPWCERQPYSLSEDQRLIGSWEKFCDFIKHKRRYFFMQETAEPEALREYLTPSELLQFIGKTVSEHELVKELPMGSLIYRARQYKAAKVPLSPYEFGPPPVESASRSNRMSPAGIVMFYGSDDWVTATAEIDDDPGLGIAVGTFRTARIAQVLDLTRLPERLGFFEQQSDSSSVDRYALDFLHSFVRSVAEKVKSGEREHVDYAPTQVFTEWFRTSFQHNDSTIDGIRYPSTQRPGGKSLVLFANRYDVTLSPKEIARIAVAASEDEWFLRSQHEKAWLKLVRRRIVRRPAV